MQPIKAPKLRLVIVNELISNIFNPLQPENACEPMVLIESGSCRAVKPEPINTSFPILASEAGKSTEVKEIQPEKAAFIRTDSEGGSFIDVNAVQF